MGKNPESIIQDAWGDVQPKILCFTACRQSPGWLLSVSIISLFFVVSTSAIDCLERLLSEVTYYVSSGM